MLRAKGFSTVDVTVSEKLLAGMDKRMCVATLEQEGVVQNLRAELNRTAGLHTTQPAQDQQLPYPAESASATQHGVQKIAQDQENSVAPLRQNSSLDGTNSYQAY
eukprot:COSAG05_NODE_7863_length_761_cov_1.575529_1_plen_104_part_10